MTRRSFVDAYTASAMRRLRVNDPGRPSEMVMAELTYRDNALKLWRKLAPGVRSLTLPAFEELLKFAEDKDLLPKETTTR